MAKEILDESVLEGLRQIDSQDGTLLDDLFQLFLKTAPHGFQRVKAAITSQNAKGLESEAHSLKSTAGNLGATELQAMCLKLEQHGVQGEMPAAVAALPRFEELFGEVHAEIQRRVKK